jgi:hypothetical protein
MNDGERPPELGATPAPKDFFDRMVQGAKNQGGFDTSRASDVYVVALLTEAAQSPAAIPNTEQPFTLRLAKAMHASGGERFERCRKLGDDILFVSGFFTDHLKTRGLGLDYMSALGQSAYGGAAAVLRTHASGPQLFDELATRFGVFVELLRYVADSMFAVSARDELSVLELYERWQRSRSEVLARALLEWGLLPSGGPSETN